jgi:hypothetical protein
MSVIDDSFVAHYITQTFANVETETNYGYTFYFYGSDHRLPFATLISTDNEYDCISNLDRPGIFRLNIGVSKQTFQSLFGMAPVDITNCDLTALDTVMPHPEYAPQSFICVLSPSEATFAHVRQWLAEAYDISVQRQARRTKPE